MYNRFLVYFILLFSGAVINLYPASSHANAGTPNVYAWSTATEVNDQAGEISFAGKLTLIK